MTNEEKILSNAGIYQLGFKDGQKSVNNKIKAKIEELQKECKNCEWGKFLCKHCFSYEGKKILQSLIERE